MAGHEGPSRPPLSSLFVQVALPVGATVPATSNTEKGSKERPAHHLNDCGTSFVNPWPSFRPQSSVGIFKWMANTAVEGYPKVPTDIDNQVRKQTPTWGIASPTPSALDDTTANTDRIKATWLGHACFLLEFPAPEGSARGVRILFDPVFSNRCSPSQIVGPARYTKPPCEMSDIPPFEAIIISHNHYDHMDTDTLKTLENIHKPHMFAPLGNESYFKGLGIPLERTHCMDWWETKNLTVGLPKLAPTEDSDSISSTVGVTCTPCQHFTGRGLLDRFKSLWSSWAIEDFGTGFDSATGKTTTPGSKAWFAGDTGYRAVLDGDNEDEVPVCPEFKKIGEKFGGFDLAFIPIGAYLPRNLMSMVHCAPQDSVRLFQDVRAKRAIGMHWGTWILTNEPVMDPPKRLAQECAKIGILPGAFDVCGLGETVVV